MTDWWCPNCRQRVSPRASDANPFLVHMMSAGWRFITAVVTLVSGLLLFRLVRDASGPVLDDVFAFIMCMVAGFLIASALSYGVARLLPVHYHCPICGTRDLQPSAPVADS